jgi:hypothetical protein
LFVTLPPESSPTTGVGEASYAAAPLSSLGECTLSIGVDVVHADVPERARSAEIAGASGSLIQEDMLFSPASV